jgi:hypothetical protein
MKHELNKIITAKAQRHEGNPDIYFFFFAPSRLCGLIFVFDFLRHIYAKSVVGVNLPSPKTEEAVAKQIKRAGERMPTIHGSK